MDRGARGGATDWGTALVAWFCEAQRDLPWRHTADPYRVWVSEIMLQQTRVETVLPYYERFMTHYPTVEALAAAPIERVLKDWEGLGYYSRARHLHAAAVTLTKERRAFPTTVEELRTLPGVGDYTAAAIYSIAFNRPAPAVDGNVLRVVTRLYASEDDIAKEATKKKVAEEIVTHVPTDHASDFTQGLMELGALVCTPKHPDCERCPMQTHCAAFGQGRTAELPFKTKPHAPKQEQIEIAVIVDENGHVLMHRRPEQGLLKGLWEYPSTEALQEIGVVGAMKNWFSYDHVFTHRRWHVQVCRADFCRMRPLNENWKYHAVDDMKDIMIAGAFKKIREALEQDR